jgi:hypothetical protein
MVPSACRCLWGSLAVRSKKYSDDLGPTACGTTRLDPAGLGSIQRLLAIVWISGIPWVMSRGSDPVVLIVHAWEDDVPVRCEDLKDFA